MTLSIIRNLIAQTKNDINIVTYEFEYTPTEDLMKEEDPTISFILSGIVHNKRFAFMLNGATTTSAANYFGLKREAAYKRLKRSVEAKASNGHFVLLRKGTKGRGGDSAIYVLSKSWAEALLGISSEQYDDFYAKTVDYIAENFTQCEEQPQHGDIVTNNIQSNQVVETINTIPDANFTDCINQFEYISSFNASIAVETLIKEIGYECILRNRNFLDTKLMSMSKDEFINLCSEVRL